MPCGNLGGIKGDDSSSKEGKHSRRREVRLAQHLGGLSHRSPHSLLRHLLHDDHLRRVAGSAAGDRPRPVAAGRCADVRGGRLLLQFPRHDLPSAGRDRHCPGRLGERHGGSLAHRPGRQPDGHNRHADRRHHCLFRPGGLGLRPVAPWLPRPLYPLSGHWRLPRRHRLPAADRRHWLGPWCARQPSGISHLCWNQRRWCCGFPGC